jgi:hypothetical protein
MLIYYYISLLYQLICTERNDSQYNSMIYNNLVKLHEISLLFQNDLIIVKSI